MVNDQSNATYDAGNEIIYNTEVDINVTAAPATQYYLKIVHHLLNVSQELMELQQMMKI